MNHWERFKRAMVWGVRGVFKDPTSEIMLYVCFGLLFLIIAFCLSFPIRKYYRKLRGRDPATNYWKYNKRFLARFSNRDPYNELRAKKSKTAWSVIFDIVFFFAFMVALIFGLFFLFFDKIQKIILYATMKKLSIQFICFGASIVIVLFYIIVSSIVVLLIMYWMKRGWRYFKAQIIVKYRIYHTPMRIKKVGGKSNDR